MKSWLLVVGLPLIAQQQFTVTAGQKIRIPITCVAPGCTLGTGDTDFFITPKDLDVGNVNNMGDYQAPWIIKIAKSIFIGAFIQGNYTPQIAQINLAVSSTCTPTTCPVCPTVPPPIPTPTPVPSVQISMDTSIVPTLQLAPPVVGSACNTNIFSKDASFLYFCDGKTWRALAWTK